MNACQCVSCRREVHQGRLASGQIACALRTEARLVYRRRLIFEPLEQRTVLSVVGLGMPDVAVNEDAVDTFIRLRDWFDEQPGGAAGLTFAISMINPPSAAILSSTAIETGMADTRTAHTITKLASGKVLVTGGFFYDGSEPITLDSAELYDPISATWTIVAPLHVARRDHAAALLADGRVLVTGGSGDGATPLSSGEVYNPATNTWSVVNPMATQRLLHTATLLPSGKVLVAGGQGSSPTTSAELYDPVTNSWSPAGALASSRLTHTATALTDGTVLVVGGLDANGNILVTAERYDPANNTWSGAGALGVPRQFHAATRLNDGSVLVTGGSSDFLYFGLSSAERYVPGTNTWTTVAPMSERRLSHTATLMADGRVLVAGGDNGIASLDTAEVYDPLLNSWVDAGTFGNARSSHSAALLADGSVLISGGLDYSNIGPPDTLATSELYTPGAGLWNRTAPVLRLGYAKDEFGTAQITIRATDSAGAWLDDMFQVTVNAVNDAPKFEPGLDLTVNDSSGPQSLANWATQISKGPANEAAQSLVFVAVGNSNTALFASPPAIDASGRLTFAPAPNARGTANITIKLTDSGGTANGGIDTSALKTFSVTVNKPHKWHNTLHGLDVTGAGGIPDNQVVAGDALTIINYINAFGAGQVPALAVYGPPYLDTSGDDWVVAGDVLNIVNWINAFGAGLPGPEGEAAAVPADALFQALGQRLNPSEADLLALLWDPTPLPRKKN